MLSYTLLVVPRNNCDNTQCYNLHRYKKVALIVDDSPTAAALTPDSPDWVTGPFDMLNYKTGEPLTGKEFKLDWTTNGDDQYAQVEFLEIDFIRGIST